MSNRFKFRGKRLDSGTWIYGSYLFYSESLETPEEHFVETKNGWRHEVSPATVGMFTGLHDKDGKEIWEGDIVKHYAGDIWQVKYQYGYDDGHAWMGYECFAKSEWHRIAIIGNIHDNPDLLNDTPESEGK